MGLSALRNWFGRAPIPPSMLHAPTESRARSSADHSGAIPDSHWTQARIAIASTLWGAGFQLPGGEIETMRLVKPMPLATASDLLLLGAGGGGVAETLAVRLGVTVFGFEADPALVAAASAHLRGNKLARRASVSLWDPAEPELGTQAYHNCFALEPLRGLKMEPLLSAVTDSLKSGGQMILMETVADSALSTREEDVARWASIEQRQPDSLPTEIAITRVLGRLGYEVRAVEDVSQRHVQQALLGWRTLAREIRMKRPEGEDAAALIAEGERWSTRLRLFSDARLRLVRWHVVGRGMS